MLNREFSIVRHQYIFNIVEKGDIARLPGYTTISMSDYWWTSRASRPCSPPDQQQHLHTHKYDNSDAFLHTGEDPPCW